MSWYYTGIMLVCNIGTTDFTPSYLWKDLPVLLVLYGTYLLWVSSSSLWSSLWVLEALMGFDWPEKALALTPLSDREITSKQHWIPQQIKISFTCLCNEEKWRLFVKLLEDLVESLSDKFWPSYKWHGRWPKSTKEWNYFSHWIMNWLGIL